MRGMDKKGFILTETLVVSVVLLVSFTFVFTQFLTIFASYKLFENYKDIDALYASINIERFISQDNIENLTNRLEVNKLGGKPYYEFTNCKEDVFVFFNQCLTIINESHVARAFIIDYDLSNLVEFNYDNDFSYELKKYIEFLHKEKEANLIGNYRIIIETDNGNFASRIVNPKIALPSKEQYRYKRGNILFNEGTQSINLPLFSAQINPAISFSAWVKWDGTDSSGIWGHSGVENNNVHLEIWSSEFQMRLRLGQIDKSGMPLPTINKWTYITFTYDGNIARIYYDGIEVDNVTGSAGTIFGGSEHSLADSLWGGRPFYGAIKDVLIYNRTLNPIEITNNMIGNEISHDGLIYYYKMSEGLGTTLYDYSGNNNNLINTLANTIWQIETEFSEWIDGVPIEAIYPVIEKRTLYFYKGNWYTEKELEQLL